MADLTPSVQGVIEQFLASKHEYHTKADILRVFRDQSELLYERQVVLDVLTQDPMNQFDGHPKVMERIQRLLKIVSCHRLTTYEGLSVIESTIQLDKDDQMKFVDNNIQISFRYERRPMPTKDIHDGHASHDGTYIVYTIDISKDFGRKLRLMTIECWARGQVPSVQLAKLIDGWEDMEEDEIDMETTRDIDESEDTNSHKSEQADISQEVDMHESKDDSVSLDNTDDDDDADRFTANMDPDVLETLKSSSGLEVEDEFMLFLLMTFPYWEQEWDLVGFALDAIFGDDDDDEVIEFDEEGNEIRR
jgi:hypothetical protein